MQNSGYSIDFSIGADYAGFNSAIAEIGKSLQNLADHAARQTSATQDSAQKSVGETTKCMESISYTVRNVEEQIEATVSAPSRWNKEAINMAGQLDITADSASVLNKALGSINSATEEYQRNVVGISRTNSSWKEMGDLIKLAGEAIEDVAGNIERLNSDPDDRAQWQWSYAMNEAAVSAEKLYSIICNIRNDAAEALEKWNSAAADIRDMGRQVTNEWKDIFSEMGYHCEKFSQSSDYTLFAESNEALDRLATARFNTDQELIPSSVQQVERKERQSFFKREQSTHYQKLAGGGDPPPSYQVDPVWMQLGMRQTALDDEQSALDFRYRMGQITALQLVELERDIINRRYEIQLEGLQREIALDQTQPERKAQLYNQIEILDRDFQNAINNNARQAALEQKAIWQDVANSIKMSMEDSLVGLMNGTMSWGDATKNVLNDVLQAFIKKTAHELVQHKTIEGLKLLFTKQISNQEVATKVAAGVKAKGVTVSNAVTDITAAAPVGGAKAFTAMANIPYVGPALGAAAMAAAIGAILALTGKLSSAAGGWGEVPSDQLAMIHKKEMVLPAKYAEPLREQLESGDMGDSSPIVINLSAMDAKSSYSWMKDNAGQFRELIREQVRNFAYV